MRELAWLRRLFARRTDPRPCSLLITQVYVPDPAAVGQYMHEVARALVLRGQRAIVLAADSGYEEPERRYPRHELLDGVEIVRLPWSSFGKASLGLRLLGGGIFTGEAALLASALPRVDHVLMSTSPPMVALAGLSVSFLQRAPLSFWAMDINPDQIVATGRLPSDALPVRGFDWLNRLTLEHADAIITLDRFMAERLQGKADVAHKLHVVPPWPLFMPQGIAADAGVAFRRAHGFEGKRVLMYSGNLSPVHPVDTLLEAARQLRDDPRLLFVFVGGGLGRDAIARYVAQHALPNVKLLPYQPFDQLAQSLSAADAHLVAMGANMVGIVHPSKIYSALAVGRPVIALGPRRSHVAELVLQHDLGWHVEHGDVAAALRALRALAAEEGETLAARGLRAAALVRSVYDKERLLDAFCSHLAGPRSRMG
jgi:glycosyltransferase involved in cell wall biosynthesis